MRLALLPATLVASLAPYAAAQSVPPITGAERLVEASATFVDPFFGSPDADLESFASLVPGPFDESVDAQASGFGSSTYADAEQTSDVDVAAGAFDAQGAASAGLYVQGSGDASATSRFEVEFTLLVPGRLLLWGDLGTGTSFGGFAGQDRPGDASARLVLEGSGAVLLERSAALGAPGVLLDGTVVPLRAGSYRLVVEALASDGTNGVEQVNGSLAAAVFDLQGRVEHGGPTTVSVASIQVEATGGGPGGKLVALARVRLVDETGRPVSGATVAGRFFGSVVGAGRAVSDAQGVATFAVPVAPSGPPRFAFAVDGVTHPVLVHDGSADAQKVASLH